MKLTPYTTTLTDAAKRRGIKVTMINPDPDLPIFDLTKNGQTVRCFNALTDRVGAATCLADASAHSGASPDFL
jgi:hypothetical protein